MLRADHRLRGGEDPALAVRKVPGRRARAGHADEERGRSDGHRAHVQTGARQGHAEPRNRQGRRRHQFSGTSDRSAPHHAQSGPARLHPLRLRARLHRRAGARADGDRSLVPAPGARDGGSGKGSGRGHIRGRHAGATAGGQARRNFRQLSGADVEDQPPDGTGQTQGAGRARRIQSRGYLRGGV